MKKLLLLINFIFISVILYSQNNTFPTTGNVGIGTLSPLGQLQINSIRPILFKYNGGSGVYGSEIGFNAMLNTDVVPNQFKKLGGTNQFGGSAIVVDYTGNMFFQMYNAGTDNESIINYNPQVSFLNNGSVGIGTSAPNAKLSVVTTESLIADFRSTQSNGYIQFTQSGTPSFYMGNSTSGGLLTGSLSNSFNFRSETAMHFAGNGDQLAMTITNGKIGIGTTAPIKTLTIRKDISNGLGASLMLQNEQYSGNDGAETEIVFSTLTSGGNIYRYSKIHNVGSGPWGEPGRLSIGMTDGNSNYQDILNIVRNGNVGIGTTTPQNKLDVLGTIRCTEVKVEAPWADFVFHPTYQLRSLGEVERFIKANKHLPEIPTAAEVKQNGVSLGEMNAKLLQKVEELTLYLIEKDKENKEIRERVKQLELEIQKIKSK